MTGFYKKRNTGLKRVKLSWYNSFELGTDKMCKEIAMKYIQIHSIVINTCKVIKPRDIYPQIRFARKVTRCI